MDRVHVAARAPAIVIGCNRLKRRRQQRSAQQSRRDRGV
jgi:hypothetical protein